MEPLLRVYSVFSGAPTWLQELTKRVTSSVHRFIIPGDTTKGVLQISYTDSRDTEPLRKILKEDGEAALGTYLARELGSLLGERIPEPQFTRAHFWGEGVTYWLPGNYEPAEESAAMCRPLPDTLPNVFVCGESYSLRQCWVEGALEHADRMLGVFKHWIQ